jgi:hypothetical protein
MTNENKCGFMRFELVGLTDRQFTNKKTCEHIQKKYNVQVQNKHKYKYNVQVQVHVQTYTGKYKYAYKYPYKVQV